jgi:hypothetical protein
MVPNELVARWESAYRRYSAASRTLASASPSTEREAAREFALASQEVSTAWHDMENVPGLPWWVLAVLVAGAQAFAVQARDWNARAQYTWPAAVGAPPARLSTRARPNHQPDPSQGEQSW